MLLLLIAYRIENVGSGPFRKPIVLRIDGSNDAITLGRELRAHHWTVALYYSNVDADAIQLDALRNAIHWWSRPDRELDSFLLDRVHAYVPKTKSEPLGLLRWYDWSGDDWTTYYPSPPTPKTVKDMQTA